MCQHVAQGRCHYDIVDGVMDHFGSLICHLITAGLIRGDGLLWQIDDCGTVPAVISQTARKIVLETSVQ